MAVANRFREALERGEFTVTCEFIPGRGAHERVQESEIEEAKRIFATGRVHALSITDNPGGNPALMADALAREFAAQEICTCVHFTAKDRSRNQIISQLYALERNGIQNLLLMTGDYQSGGWSGRARPVFDLDSVHLQLLVSGLNAGLEVEGRRGSVTESPAHFFPGGVVNPFKYTEGEAIPQYLKMEKKLIAGARFLITQVGYDARKMDELIRYRDERGFHVPIIANVFLLTRGAAKLMRSGGIPGCCISDELMAQLEAEAKAADKGKAARIERAAKMVAVARGLGFAGVHIGGFGVTADVVCAVLDRAEELAHDWRRWAAELSYGAPDGYYVYEAELDAAGQPTGLNTATHAPRNEAEASRQVFKGWGISRFAHFWMLTLGKRGNKLLARRMEALDGRHGTHRRHGLEHVGKAMLYGCIDCGDCGLEPALYSCPMSQCPKCQRNGPCGGTFPGGWCEVFPHKRYCIWYKAYHRAKRSNQMERLTGYITPPNHWELLGGSAWSAYTHLRDNTAGRIPVSLGLDTGAPGGMAKGSAGAVQEKEEPS